MKWFEDKPRDDVAVIGAADRLLCFCGAPGPFASCVQLRTFALRGGRLISEFTHERVCCQRCGEQMTFGPEGRFRHHPNAEPFTGGGVTLPPAEPETPRRDPRIPPPGEVPMPPARQRPRT